MQHFPSIYAITINGPLCTCTSILLTEMKFIKQLSYFSTFQDASIELPVIKIYIY